MRQVAAAAGVSPMTVSYVYSRPERVSAAARASVHAAADRLGYPGPDPGARSLRRGRPAVWASCWASGSPTPSTTRRPPVSWPASRKSRAVDGVGLTLVPTTGAGSDVQRVADAVVDGFIVWTTSEDDPVLGAVAARGLPAVVHAGPRRPGLPLVGIDDRAAAAAIGALVFAGAQQQQPCSAFRSTAAAPGSWWPGRPPRRSPSR